MSERMSAARLAEIREALRTGRKRVSYVFIGRDLLKELDAMRQELMRALGSDETHCTQCGVLFADNGDAANAQHELYPDMCLECGDDCEDVPDDSFIRIPHPGAHE